MLKILVLGPPAVLIDDKPLGIQRRQLRTLLFFLACEPDGVGRDELINRFWPEKKEADARRQLREVLSKLRRQLPDPETLQTDHDRVWLNPQLVYIDYSNFLKVIASAEGLFKTSHDKTTLSDSMVDNLKQAVELWRSPQFLAGARISNSHEFDDWIQAKTSTLEYHRLQCLERLADHFTSIGDLDKAILYVNKALEADALNNILQRQMLSLLYGAGRISEAQSYYSYLMELYQREYDNELPGIENFDIGDGYRNPFENRSPNILTPLTSRNLGHIFVGRVNELEKLENAYSQGGVLIIIGEIGSGKTALVQRMAASLLDKSRQFYIACRSQEFNQPLQPLINLVREFIDQNELNNLDVRWQNALSIIFPDLFKKTDYPMGNRSSMANETRLELFEAFHQLFLLASRSSRILLIIDNIQWCDSDTLEVLMFLTRHDFFKQHGFLVVLSRTEIENPKIHDILMVDKNHSVFPRINMSPLSRDDISTLAQNILNQEPTGNFVAKLQKATGGNPLFIIETLHALQISSTNAAIFAQDNIPLAESLTSVFVEKERNLSDDAREVLSVAAICGLEFQYDILDHSSLFESADLVRCLEELEEKRFIRPLKSGSILGQYSFIHSLLRDSLLSRLSPARQCYLHEIIAQAIIASKGSQNNRLASIIARHFEAAGKPVLAFQYWIKAGLYARSLYSIQEAYNAFGMADRIKIENEQDIPEEDLYELYANWCDLAYSIMDITSLQECSYAMYETGEKLHDDLLTGAGLSGLALSAIFKIEIDKALAYLGQSIQLLSKTDNLYEKVMAFCRLGMAYSVGLMNDKALEAYKEAINLGKGLPNQTVRQAVVYVQYLLTILNCLMGMPENARVTGNQGLRNAYLLISRPTAQSDAHIALAMAAYYSGAFDEAQNHLRLSRKNLESFENSRTTALINILQARIYYHSGRFDKSWELASLALQISEEHGYFENISESHCVRGDVFLSLQNFPAAIKEYTTGYENLLDSFQGLNCYYRLGYVTAKNGDFERGIHILEEAIAMSKQAGFYYIYLSARFLLSILMMESGKEAEAQSMQDEIIKEASTRGLSMVVFPESQQQGEFICDSIDNAQAEIIISNLMGKPEFSDGNWAGLFSEKLSKSPVATKHFDLPRFIRFLNNIHTQKDG